MAEYIERKAAMTVPVLPKEYRTYPTANLDDAYEAGWNDALENLQNIPAEDVLPVERGTWIEDHDDGTTGREAGGLMIELKPCPFCGGQAKFFTKVNDAKNTSIGWFFGIFCTECGVTTPKTNYYTEVSLAGSGEIEIPRDDRLEAIEAWNRRVDDDGT